MSDLGMEVDGADAGVPHGKVHVALGMKAQNTNRMQPQNTHRLKAAEKKRIFAESTTSESSIPAIDYPEDDWSEDDDPAEKECRHLVVFKEDSTKRRCWDVVLSVLVLYVGTIFLFRLAFVEFSIAGNDLPEWNPWSILDEAVNGLFCVDLVLPFFFSYTDRKGKEVTKLSSIATRYLCGGSFLFNAVACMPWNHLEDLFDAHKKELTVNRTIRITRIQRVSRIARLIRLGRLAKIADVRNPIFEWLQTLRFVRLIRVVAGLLFIVHVLACGWYLCAALHEDPKVTWVARRLVDVETGSTLMEREAWEQWLHAMYFVLTVFTTVGFGDICAATSGEILYACFTMFVGAVVHGIIISQVINLVTAVDRIEEFAQQQETLAEAFANHAELDRKVEMRLKGWVQYSARGWVDQHFDQEEMKQLFTRKNIPIWLLAMLPETVFNGQLMKNRFLHASGVLKQLEMPPRLPVLLAIALNRSHFERDDFVYQTNDFPVTLYLVVQGTFAHVAMPSSKGGVESSSELFMRSEEEINSEAEMVRRVGGKDINRRTSRRPLLSTTSNSPLYPYKLLCVNSYFGEVEIMMGTARRSTVRCESHTGSLLVLHKQAFQDIALDFPQFGISWKRRAARQEQLRLRLLRKLKRGVTYRQLAAVRIQQFFRLRVLDYDRSRFSTPKHTTTRERLATRTASRGEQDQRDTTSSDTRLLLGQVQSLSQGMEALRHDFFEIKKLLVEGAKDSPPRTQTSPESAPPTTLQDPVQTPRPALCGLRSLVDVRLLPGPRPLTVQV